MAKRFLLLTMMLNLAAFTGFAKDIILDEKPVKIPLPVGKEIIVKFPQAVTQTEDIEGNTESLKQFLRPDGVLLLKAGEAFGEARMAATQIDGKVVVMDLNAKIGAINHEKINLIDPQSFKKEQPNASGVIVRPVQDEKQQQNPYKPAFLKNGGVMTKNAKARGAKAKSDNIAVGFNQMVQYGFRHFVGPARLIGKQKAKRVPVSRSGVSRLVRVWGSRLSIRPLRQWKMGDKYITVLLVNNTSNQLVEFDPRSLRGRIMFSAALYPVIEPQGSHQDQTLWAVITGEPFNKAIR